MSGARIIMREPSGRCFDRVHDLLDALLLNHAPALGTMRLTDAREEQTQVVVDFRHRADGRARIVADALLVNRNRGRQSFDLIHVGLFHLPEELARVRAQRFDVAALSFRVDRIERERRFARTRTSP